MTRYHASTHATGRPSYTWTFPADAQSVGEARLLTATAVRAWELDPLLDDAVLIASELATNVVRHAAVPSFRLTLLLRDTHRMRVAVTDVLKCTRPMPRRAGNSDEAGRGLALVTAIAETTGWDELGWGKRLWADLTARPQPSTSRRQ
ncbi:hypothetical protein ADK55_03200 [Streptomyces sp. WM4235]|uniref:ATP-binding protein n=1 Tax=Streptomyces sp. WM4235 TaxID=1415551 RepID=UPI0006AF0B40|nr:ATP-binding protein [Streptomyces sp. WM4235]KOU67559.1 hypothetical protein ADK55_03200 [Streptomyces sp. WM4235]